MGKGVVPQSYPLRITPPQQGWRRGGSPPRMRGAGRPKKKGRPVRQHRTAGKQKLKSGTDHDRVARHDTNPT